MQWFVSHFWERMEKHEGWVWDIIEYTTKSNLIYIVLIYTQIKNIYIKKNWFLVVGHQRALELGSIGLLLNNRFSTADKTLYCLQQSIPSIQVLKSGHLKYLKHKPRAKGRFKSPSSKIVMNHENNKLKLQILKKQQQINLFHTFVELIIILSEIFRS